MSNAGELTPLGMIIAGVVFILAGLYNLSISDIGIVIGIGVVLFVIGVIALIKENKWLG